MAELRRVLEINREQTGPHLELAFVQLLAGEPGEAARHLDAVLGSDPGSAPAHFLEGFLAWSKKDTSGATEHYAAAGDGPGEAAPAGGSGEGDTRRGARPLVASSAHCRGAEGILWELLREARGRSRHAAGLRPVMEEAYRALDRLLDDARGRAAL